MKVDGEKTTEMIPFVERQLKNITNIFGVDWTSRLDPIDSHRFTLGYRFSNSYFLKKMATSLVESKTVDEFNIAMNFYTHSAETSHFIFDIVENLERNCCRKVTSAAKELQTLLIEFKDTSAIRNLKKMYTNYY
ncbi:unnamed protein product [Dimorphilus gyrociliatus]|uniref:Uncharacterized protein n=1 Tax=Dimorphilus gyrociliatus TaxID=2664684 RepID=A0A7I8WFP8_9ANNE|nr:unnamed protein product [Dimorphilus gyrociliatus]